MSSEYRYRPGQIVPGTDLKIIMPIGSGGMGSVYEVEETSVEAPFVMKVIHPELLRDNAEHVRENAGASAVTLDSSELSALDAAFPVGPPRRGVAML